MAVIAVPIYTHFFPPEEYGRFDLTNRFVLFLAALSMVWLDHVVLRFYPAYRQRNTLGSFVSGVSVIRLGGAAAGLVVLAAVYVAGPDAVFASFRDLFGLAACVFLAQNFFERGLAMLRAKQKALAFSIASSLHALGKVGLGLLLAVGLGLGVPGLLYAAAGVPFLLYLVFVRGHFGGLGLPIRAPERRFIGEALSYGLPVGVTLLLNFFLCNADRYLLKYFYSDAEVGVFSIGSFFADQPIILLSATLMLAIFPNTSREYESAGPGAASALIGFFTRVFLLLCVPAAAGLACLAQPILQTFADEKYHAAYPVVAWIASATLLLGLSQYAQLGLHLAKRTLFMVFVTVAAIAVNLACNWLLIPRCGFVACGIARLISNAVLLAGFAAVSEHCLHWQFPMGSLLRIAVAAGVMALAMLGLLAVLPDTAVALAAVAVIGSAAYAIMLFLVREVRPREVRKLIASVTGGEQHD
ncbi:MAG: lipopolysaccharide biosynthesis protein [Candidatus Hydrogenedentes bacterium]|nr:lipopolysaccharide biosynthesis protein [Candidatus Hydrogenedentota bacterium]